MSSNLYGIPLIYQQQGEDFYYARMLIAAEKQGLDTSESEWYTKLQEKHVTAVPLAECLIKHAELLEQDAATLRQLAEKASELHLVSADESIIISCQESLGNELVEKELLTDDLEGTDLDFSGELN